MGQGGGKWTNYPDETIPEAFDGEHDSKTFIGLKHSEIAKPGKPISDGEGRGFMPA